MIINMRVLPNTVASSLLATGKSIQADLPNAVYRTGAMFRTKVRAAASGRPGPRVVTGNYRRSIAQTNTKDRDGAVAYVHTNSPQAMRLEYGFVGRDAAGRHYNQPPYPHWAPALQGIDKVLEQQINIAIAKAIKTTWRPGT